MTTKKSSKTNPDTKPKRTKTTGVSRARAREAAKAKEAADVEKRKALFLDEYSERLSIKASCEAIGVGESTVYRWRKDDKVFAGQIREFRVDAITALEESLYERAKGYKVETVDKYGNVTTRLEFSDKAAEMWLRANDPTRYGNKIAVDAPRESSETDELLDAILADPARKEYLFAALDAIDDTAL